MNEPRSRRPAVAGAFYPGDARELDAMVDRLVRDAQPRTAPDLPSPLPAGLLVPHAGLEYSGLVAATAWVQLTAAPPETTVVILGTNHGAAWLDGVSVWDRGAWELPHGAVETDERLAAAIVELGRPISVDRAAHRAEHSIEVQLPVLRRCAPAARIVALSVSTGRGHAARATGRRLGELLRHERESGRSVVIAISTDMAHYPPAGVCTSVTDTLVPPIVTLDAAELDARESAVRRAGLPNLFCGMCGIEPAIVGLAALSALGCSGGSVLCSATSADAGGPANETVGYLSVRFDAVPTA